MRHDRVKKKAAVVAVVLIVTGGLAALALRGPDPDAVPTADDVSRRTMSPYCEGLTLQECPATQSRELRAEVSRKIASGWTNARIDRWLVDNYGPQVLGDGQPAARLIPVAGVLAGLTIVILFLARRGGATPQTAEDVDETALSSVRSELEEFRRGSTE